MKKHYILLSHRYGASLKSVWSKRDIICELNDSKSWIEVSENVAVELMCVKISEGLFDKIRSLNKKTASAVRAFLKN